jgi:starvation-inducible outer membrane lipoprotein
MEGTTMKALMIVIALSLIGCASQPEKIRYEVKEVKNTVSTKCVKDLPKQPEVKSDAEVKSMSDFDATTYLLMDRKEYQRFVLEANAAMEGCK